MTWFPSRSATLFLQSAAPRFIFSTLIKGVRGSPRASCLGDRQSPNGGQVDSRRRCWLFHYPHPVRLQSGLPVYPTILRMIYSEEKNIFVLISPTDAHKCPVRRSVCSAVKLSDLTSRRAHSALQPFLYFSFAQHSNVHNRIAVFPDRYCVPTAL